ncbi:hypothetical protein [Actinokineospora globicatena]|uniref:hypothetical protein n=1 Tax=Actinokineospora globicatena TaxID=103729 RepID=UPI002552CA3A|nr:hypothetical protein [Actinokineospora globicatena]
MLAAQEKSSIDLTSSVVDYEFGDDASAGAYWRITPAGVVGADGRLNTDLAALAEEGEISANISGIPGTLTTTDGATWFDPTGPGELADGNRIVFTRPGVVLTVGRVHRRGDRWMVTRTATTEADVVAIFR